MFSLAKGDNRKDTSICYLSLTKHRTFYLTQTASLRRLFTSKVMTSSNLLSSFRHLRLTKLGALLVQA